MHKLATLGVRNRTPADMDAVVAILRSCHEHDRYPLQWPKDPARWVQPPRELWALVAVGADAQVHGHVGVHAAEGHPTLPVWTGDDRDSLRLAIVSRLIVDPVWRGQGVGSKLIGRACEVIQSQRLTPVLEVARDNAIARAFYRGRGWIELGTPPITNNRTIPVVAMIYPNNHTPGALDIRPDALPQVDE